jgi:glycine betaine/choline ABC-type transport system substrate-binding protein
MARNAAAMKALRPLVQSISSQTMSRANAIVDVDGKSIAEAAVWLSDQIKSNGK